MPENKTKKFIRNFISKLLVVFVFIFLLGTYLKTFAIGSPYQPGSTLDPACAPTEINCFVQIIPDQTSHTNNLLMTDGSSTAWTNSLYWDQNTNRLGIGTSTPQDKLDVSGNINLANDGTDRYIRSVRTTIGGGSNMFISAGNGVSAMLAGSGGDLNLTGGAGGSGSSFGGDVIINAGSGQTSGSIILGNVNGNVGIGTTTPSTALDVVGTITGSNLIINGNNSYNLSAPTNLVALQTCLGGCPYFANGSTGSPHNYRVYSYKNVIGGRVYSVSYATLSTNFTDDGSNTSYDISVSWNPVAGVDGYRILTYDPTVSGYNYDAGYDTASTSFIDDSCSTTCFDPNPISTRVSPSGIYTNTNIINGTLNLSDPISMKGNSIGADYNNNFFMVTGGTPISSGVSNTIIIGDQAGHNATGIYNSNFLGSNAGLSATNSFYSNFLGSNAGENAVNANGSNFFGKDAGNGATNASLSNFFGMQSGQNATGASNSNFLGPAAGQSATSAHDSNFIGWQAGINASNAPYSDFIGRNAGFFATNASDSNFFGEQSGYQATNASNSNFLGHNTGYGATTAGSSNFFGYYSGYFAANASNSNFFGFDAGYFAINASNSIFIGQNAGSGDIVNNTNNTDDFSILIGKDTSTGGNKNSIALGGSAVNTAQNQFMIGSTTRPIDSTRINGSSSTQCTITTGTGIACTSDERLKTNIVDIPNVLDTLSNIRPVNYNWLAAPNGKQQIGFLAQNLEQYLPQLVATDSDGYKSVYYAQMTPILVKAIQEMNLKITGISDMTKENSWRDSFIAWFSNAANHITRIFTGEICLTDPDGTSECINKTELHNLKQLINIQTPPQTPPSDVPPVDVPPVTPDIVPPQVPEVVPPAVDPTTTPDTTNL